jgi:excinuclease ABC subunit C
VLEESLNKINPTRVRISQRVRNKRRHALESAVANAKQALESYLLSASLLSKRLQNLVEILHLENAPERIECFDISHTMGEATKASCVVFGRDGAVKSDYRRYNIKDIEPGDDYAAMRQVLERRYSKRLQSPEQLPDLILIDGGKGQLNASLEVLSEYGLDHLPIFGLAKREEEVFVPGRQDPILLPRNSQGRFLIQRVRDEAHRYAITTHRRARNKLGLSSTLEAIPGVGPGRRKALLKAFGSMDKIRAATVEELAAVPGMTLKVAQQVKEFL